MTTRRLVFESRLPATQEQAFAWHARSGAIDRMLPPWQSVRVEKAEGIGEGSIASFRLGVGPFSLGWRARHGAVDAPRGFSDRQEKGPFRSWVHKHDFLSFPTPEGQTTLRDDIEYELPWGTQTLADTPVRRELERMFAYRHRTLVADLASQARYAPALPRKIAVTGASGLIGSALVAYLRTAGVEVVTLVRSPDTAAAQDTVLWDPQRGILEPEKMQGVDAVVHLAGENIAGSRWTAKQKAAILESRTRGTLSLVESLSALDSPPRLFVSASAIGFYGDTGSESVDEAGAVGQGFLSETCQAWENAAAAAEGFAARVASLRFGVVLSPAGGALAKMLPPFQMGAGGVIGSGRQFMSWVSLDDAITAIVHVLCTPSIVGAVNIVAPDSRSNHSFTKALGKVLKRPTLIPLPAFAVKLLFGEMGEAMLLSSTRVRPGRLVESGFEFRHPNLEDCLGHVLGRAPFPASLRLANDVTHRAA